MRTTKYKFNDNTFNWLKIRTFESLSNVVVYLISKVLPILYNSRDISSVTRFHIGYFVLKHLRYICLN